jgi:hypothetical protein
LSSSRFAPTAGSGAAERTGNRAQCSADDDAYRLAGSGTQDGACGGTGHEATADKCRRRLTLCLFR